VIPRVLHRCVPADVPPRFADHWCRWLGLHHGWEAHTWQDPIDPAAFPLTRSAWSSCRAGAQLAGLVRLEAVYRHGGIFLDWDVRPVAPLDPLLDSPGGMFAAWEDDEHVPDAVFGAEPQHPVVGELLQQAVARTLSGADIWTCSVGLFSERLPGSGVTLLPSSSFYPVHYSVERAQPGASASYVADEATTFGVHEWAWSWGPDASDR
jgi:mannosyltransferase OCH1-like enzyme